MTKATIARRYAKALLLLGKKEKRIQEIADELTSLLALIDKVGTFWDVVNNPLYSLDRRKQILLEVAKVTGMRPEIVGLLRLLLEKGRLRYLPLIISSYQAMADEAMGRLRARVYSAVELTGDEREKIRGRIKRFSGKEVVLETTLTPSLIGGLVTKIGGVVLDGSLKTQLLRMKESLAKG